jgi:hypothetical protein
MKKDQIINWLLEGDPSIQYQTYRDLLEVDKKSLQNKIAKEVGEQNIFPCKILTAIGGKHFINLNGHPHTTHYWI